MSLPKIPLLLRRVRAQVSYFHVPPPPPSLLLCLKVRGWRSANHHFGGMELWDSSWYKVWRRVSCAGERRRGLAKLTGLPYAVSHIFCKEMYSHGDASL